MMENQALYNLIANIKTDVEYVKENMVTYREYNHLHQEYHATKAEVDVLAKTIHERKWTHELAGKAVWVVLGGVLAAVLKLVGVY